MKTFSGLEAPLAPGVGQVSLIDLVVQLGRERRFNNAGSLEWTVLHHSFLVALLWIRGGFPPDEVAFALLHDAHEAYTGDIPGPVKAAIRRANPPSAGLTDPIRSLEATLDSRIREELAFLFQDPSDQYARRLKICDLAALVVEGVIFGAPGCDCTVDVPETLSTEVYELIETALPDLSETVDRLGRVLPPMLRKTYRRVAQAQAKEATNG